MGQLPDTEAEKEAAQNVMASEGSLLFADEADPAPHYLQLQPFGSAWAWERKDLRLDNWSGP